MRVTILVGAAPFELADAAAARLESAIRGALLDDAGHPIALDGSIRACLQLPYVIREDRGRGSSPAPRLRRSCRARQACGDRPPWRLRGRIGIRSG